MSSLPVVIANTVNPVLSVLLLAVPLATPRQTAPWRFYGRSAIGLGLAVALAESGKRFQIWPGHPSFPSGHETYGLCVAASLAVWDRRWLAAGLPLTALLAWALVAAHFHRPVDIAGAMFVGPACALLCHLWKRQAD